MFLLADPQVCTPAEGQVDFVESLCVVSVLCGQNLELLVLIMLNPLGDVAGSQQGL